MNESSRVTPAQTALAVVLQVRSGVLQALVWQRAMEPFAGAWSLPGGYLEPGETLEQSIRRHLAVKVDVRELSHLEQLETLSDPAPQPTAVGARDGVSRARAVGSRPGSAGGHGLAPRRRPPADGVRPRSDRASPGATACARSSRTRTSASRSRRRRSRSRSSATSTRPRSGMTSPPPTSSACSCAAASSSGRARSARRGRRADDRPRSIASARHGSRSPISSRCSGRRR